MFPLVDRGRYKLEKIAQVDAYQQKTEWSCSAGALVAVLQHHGSDVTEEEAVKAIGAREGRGAETTDIVEGARKLGFEASEGPFPTLASAKEVLKAGNPIIADVQSFNYKGKGHYIVIAGYKPGKGFLLMDPNTKGKTAVPNWRILSDKEMEKKWWDRAMAPPHELMPKWGVVVTPKKEKTANGDMIDYFNKHPQKLKEYKERRAAKKAKKEKTAVSKKWVMDRVARGLKGASEDRLEKAYINLSNTMNKAHRATSGLGAKRTGTGLTDAPLRIADTPSMRANQRRIADIADAAVTEVVMKTANDPVKEKFTLHGIPISLEWREGEVRKYFNHDPLKKKSVGTIDYNKKMKADYGYVRGVMDADGEELDVYLGPNRESERVFVLEKLRKADKSFDENKIMLGYDSMAEAKKSYLQHQGKDEMGKVRELTLPQFKSEFMSKKKTAKDKSKAPLIAAAVSAPLGFAGAAGQKKLIHDPIRNKLIPRMSMRSIAEMAQPGDIIVTSTNKLDPWKVFQATAFGTEADHIEPVVARKAGMGQTISPGMELYGSSKSNADLKLDLQDLVTKFKKRKYTDAVLLRPKNLSATQLDELVEETLTRARSRYSGATAIRAYVKDVLVPKLGLLSKDKIPATGMRKPSKRWRKKYPAGPKLVQDADDLICSTAGAAALKKVTGESVVKGVRSRNVLPHHYLRSDKFEVLGASVSRNFRVRRVSPTMVRGGLAAGLAVGAYGATKKIQSKIGKEKTALVAPMPGNVLSNANSLLPDASQLSRGAHIQAGKRMRGPGRKDPFDFGMKATLNKKKMIREMDSPLLRSGGGKKLRLDAPVKVAAAQMSSFFHELEKTGGDYATMAAIGAVIGGVRGGVKGSVPDDRGNKHRVKKFTQGAAVGAGLGTLILAGLERNADGKSTIPGLSELKKAVPTPKAPTRWEALKDVFRKAVLRAELKRTGTKTPSLSNSLKKGVLRGIL